jgi:hypothetical protein
MGCPGTSSCRIAARPLDAHRHTQSDGATRRRGLIPATRSTDPPGIDPISSWCAQGPTIPLIFHRKKAWMPAFAGMTMGEKAVEAPA